MEESADRFDAFVRDDGERLRRALVSAYGPLVGHDVAQAALAYAWEHWPKIEPMDNPVGYLYRVGQSAAKRERRRPAFDLTPPTTGDADYEPRLVSALAGLTEHQRTAVLLVHGYGYGLTEAAELLGISISTIRNHLRRGLDKLRHELGVDNVRI